MTHSNDLTHWLETQIGLSRAEVLAAAMLKAQEAKDVVKQTQKGGRAVRGGVTMQMRAQVSAASKADSRIRAFLAFARDLKKRPTGVMAADWVLYRKITEGWVGLGDVDAVVLDLFG